MQTLNSCIQNLVFLETDIQKYLQKLNIDVSNLGIDHLGMKFTEQEDVLNLIDELEKNGAKMVSSVIMKNRVFRIFELSTPITFLGKEVLGIELPDIKPNAIRKRIGFEHVEIYFDKPLANADELEQYFLEIFPDYDKNFQYQLENPQVVDQLPNPTLVFENKDEEFEIKFHPKSIFDVVKGS